MRRERKQQRGEGRRKEHEWKTGSMGHQRKGHHSPLMLTHHFNRHTQTWMWPTEFRTC